MPELPEVETIACQLARVLPGRVIERIDGLQGQSLNVEGMRVDTVGRKQKIIVVELTENLVLLVHLKMTGQLIYVSSNSKITHPPKGPLPPLKREGEVDQRIVGGHPTADWVNDLPSKHTRVIISFTDGSKLFFNDQRKFGWMRVVDSDQWAVNRSKMPPDVVDNEFSLSYLGKVLIRSRRAVKLVILDQAKIGGMGNIYACDALYLAGINPKTPANQLKDDAVKKLYLAMKTVIDKGIETGGASMSHYVGIEGIGGHYQDYFLVYGKEGELCVNCGSIIEKMKLGGRGTYWCPKCQR